MYMVKTDSNEKVTGNNTIGVKTEICDHDIHSWKCRFFCLHELVHWVN